MYSNHFYMLWGTRYDCPNSSYFKKRHWHDVHELRWFKTKCHD